jgi:elongation factor 1 alpha-like protein
VNEYYISCSGDHGHLGHVDAGKSTLMGHLLYLIGNVSKRAMHKNEVESQKIGKGSFAYAWILDETGEERTRGITMDVAQQEFETAHRRVILLDAPGHRDFIPNMITGAAQADVSILVVNAATGEFEAGFESGGQTREHAMLVRSFGVKQMAVAVNKMDTVEWSERRFLEIVAKLKLFLKQAGYRESDVSYIPCSGLTGENLVTKSTVSELTVWYTGPTLLAIIDQFTPPSRPVEKPFRCCVADIFKAPGSGFNVAGRIDSGHIQVGETVAILPVGETATVKSITLSERTEPWAVAGDQVVLTVQGVEINKLTIGNVLCSMDNPAKTTSKIQARVITFNMSTPITNGFPVVMHYLSVNEPAVVTKLISVLHKGSGEVLKRKPRCLSGNSTAVIQLDISRPVCMELYQDCRELGRFMLRSGDSTIAAGVVTKIL